MDMPKIIELNDNSSLDETIGLLLSSTAEEELALANLMNATAAALQTLSELVSNPEMHSQIKDVNSLCKSINKTLETVIMKEWILSKKLDDIFDVLINHCEKTKKKKKTSS